MTMKLPSSGAPAPGGRRTGFGTLALLLAASFLLSACPSGAVQLEPEKRKGPGGEVLPSTKRTQAREHFVKGNELVRKGNFKGAVKRYDKALEADPKFRDAYINRGIAHAELPRLDKALVDFAEALELGPDDALVYFNLGNIYSIKAQWEMAIKCYRKALEIEDNHEGALNNLGNAQASASLTDDAIETFRRYSELFPDKAEGHNNLGVALEMGQRPGEAQQAYRRAISANPKHPDAYMNLGKLHRKNGNACEAIKTLSQFIKLIEDPDDINRLKMEGIRGTLLAKCPSGASYLQE